MNNKQLLIDQIRAEFERVFDVDHSRCAWDGQRYKGIDAYDPDDTRTAAAFTLALTAWQAAHAKYAMPECHGVIGGKRTEHMDNKELRYHLQESSKIMQHQADEIAELRASAAGGVENDN